MRTKMSYINKKPLLYSKKVNISMRYNNMHKQMNANIIPSPTVTPTPLYKHS